MFKIKNYELGIRNAVLSFLMLFFVTALFAQQPDTVQQGTVQEVTIEFTRPTVQQSANVTTISMPQIRAQQGNGSVNNLLEMMPSVVTSSESGTGLGATYMFIRGIDQTRINTTLNGATINNAESQGSWLVNLPDMGAYIENVSVQSGANTSDGSTSYGARINFVTRDIPVKPFAELRSSYGSFNTFHNMVSAGTGLLGKRFSMLASFSDIRSNGYIDHSDVRLNSAFLTAELSLYNFKKNKDNGKLRFHLLFGNEKSGLAWNGVPYDSLQTNRTYNSCGEYYDANGVRHYYDNSYDNYRQTFYQLEYVKDWIRDEGRQRHSLHVMPYLTRGYGYYEQYKDDKKINKYGLVPLHEVFNQTDLVTRKYLDNYYYGVLAQTVGSHVFKNHQEQGLRWVAGMDFSNYNGKHYGDIVWVQPDRVVECPPMHEWYRGTGDKLQTKIFGNLRYWYRNFSVTGELQYRWVNYDIKGVNDELTPIPQKYDWTFLNPKITLHYLLHGAKLKHSFDLSFATANREPTRNDLVGAPDGRKPVPETLYDLEFSYMNYTDKFFFNATLYGMYYKNQLVRSGELDQTGDPLMVNIDKSYRAGIELSAAYRPVRFFTWHINGGFSVNRALNYTHYTVDWENGGYIAEKLGNTPLAYSPNIVLGNDFTFTPLKDFNISLITKFVSKQYLDNSGDEKYILKPYTYTNLRLSYTFHFNHLKDLELFLNVNNLFNAKYESNAAVYTGYYGGEKLYDPYYFPQAGINFLGGVRVKF
ncbi:MAG: TonB-dependent receptor [Bacteroidales bacterium]|nr:TonB-dependent receptor [Bacteroidales bacterium]MDY6347867.1 TonB-dependent receptor [Bacteroidales bacterium]